MISPELLRCYEHFAGVEEEMLRRVAMISELEEHKTGEPIVQDGQPATKLYIIEQGAVDLGYTIAHAEFRAVDTLVAGELLLWSALVEPYLSTANARCRTDARLVAIDAAKLRALCDENPALGYALYRSVTKVLADRLTNARVQLIGEQA